MDLMTTVTCHYCRHQSQFFTYEWPAQIFICANPKCAAVYEHIGENIAGQPLWAFRFRIRR
jgi:hypothetical protein